MASSSARCRTTTIRRPTRRIKSVGALRKRLDLFANIRPAKTREGFPARCGKTDRSRRGTRRTPRGSMPTATCFAGSGEFMPTADLALAVRKVFRARLDAHRRADFASDAAAPACHGGAQSNVLTRLRRVVPRMHPRGRGALSTSKIRRERSSTRWRRCWCATRAHST